ncbi:hypothetical protein JOC86_004867 [Bacillus pakistanensis]|uniref:Uncharacterized protein n=1 Tax=Rossellomorea pakistanensis TaxID=992288 RepID=A0ABS2NK75_9BACI|nr:hypothetical protein [Bacillus pakistanensis]MBM7588270.1 hypothetical protein [Bacillus pakistanensis]
MIHSLKEATRIYTGKFEGVLLLSLTILLPLLLIDWFIINLVYMFVFNDFTSAMADFYYILLTFIFLVIAQIPFIQFVKSYETDEKVNYKKIYYVFITNAFSLFVFGVCISFVTSIGILLFILPGLIFLIFMFVAPYEAILEGKSVWKSIKTSIVFTKRRFVPLFLIILFISLTEIIIGWVSMFLIYTVTTSLLAQLAVQMLLNLLIFPFLAIWVTYFYMEWKGKYQIS